MIYDFNLHFHRSSKSLPTNEGALTYQDIANYLTINKKTFASFSGGNFMLFSHGLTADKSSFNSLIKDLFKQYSDYSVTILVDFRDEGVIDNIRFMSSIGIKSIKFHSYFQKIAEDDYSSVLNISKHAEELGMLICIDTSYGTSGMYRFDNMKLACLITEEVSCPIVLLHSGGSRALEAMLLAEDKANIFLETSFSLPYYEGSTIEKDIVFAYKKLGASRIIYGSDFPYVSLGEAEMCTLRYLEKCGFSEKEISMVMYENAINLFSSLK